MYVHRNTIAPCNEVYARYYSKRRDLQCHACTYAQEHPDAHLQAGDAKGDKFTFHIKNMGPGTFTHDLNVLAPAYDRVEKDEKLVGERKLAVIGSYGFCGEGKACWIELGLLSRVGRYVSLGTTIRALDQRDQRCDVESECGIQGSRVSARAVYQNVTCMITWQGRMGRLASTSWIIRCMIARTALVSM